MKLIDLRNFLDFLMLNGRWPELIDEVYTSICCVHVFALLRVHVCMSLVIHRNYLRLLMYCRYQGNRLEKRSLVHW